MRLWRVPVLSFLFVSCCWVNVLLPDAIVVHNATENDLFVAPYYLSDGIVERTADPIVIAPGDVQSVERPSWSWRKDRVLFFNESVTVFEKDRCNQEELKSCASVVLGVFKGDEFFVKKTSQGLRIYPWYMWKLMTLLYGGGDLASLLALETLKQHIRDTSSAVINNPYKETKAKVRVGNALCQDEYEYLHHRKPRIKKALEKCLGYSLDDEQVPTIAVVASGGGYRSLLMTLGSLVGMEKKGIYDAVTYLTSLSGSTWGIAALFSGSDSLDECRRKMINALSIRPDEISAHEFKLMVSALLVKFAFGQPISLVDCFGAVIANRVLHDHGDAMHETYLSQQHERIKNGEHPFPIYTAVRAEEVASIDCWYEFTPYEIGGAWLSMYVPSWAYGRRFAKGQSVDYAPEQSLGFHLGVFGSAFSARISQIYHELQKRIPAQQIRASLEEQILDLIGNKHLLPAAEIFNFAAEMNGPVYHDKSLELVDGGAWPGFGLPYPPISGDRPERKVDIIIFLNNSAAIIGAPDLRFAQEYAYVKGLKFPVIDYQIIDNRVITVFKDSRDPEVPVIIYMPRINDPLLWHSFKDDERYREYALIAGVDLEKETNDGFAHTMALSYDPINAAKLSAIAEFNMMVSGDIIIDTIKQLIETKSRGKNKHQPTVYA